MRRAAWMAAFAIVVATVPHRLCAREARGWIDGDLSSIDSLESSLADTIARPLGRRDFPNGSRLLDGEWLFATYMMAGLGFGQVALAHPERRAVELARIDTCVSKLISGPVRVFDTEAWGGDDPLAFGESAHVSYLGYLNLLLSLEQLLDRHNPHAALSDRVTDVLARRFDGAREGLLPSYPGEVFPVDNAAAMASLVLHDKAVGRHDHDRRMAEFARRMRGEWIEPKTGLLRQTMPHGTPRGSGTALASYFLSWADPELSGELFAAMKRSLYGEVLGFGAMRECAAGTRARCQDVDSGPIVAGFGVSATGFGLGAARAHGDDATFARMFASAQLFGAPRAGGKRRDFFAGGPVGNAILFAMLTAPRVKL